MISNTKQINGLVHFFLTQDVWIVIQTISDFSISVQDFKNHEFQLGQKILFIDYHLNEKVEVANLE